MSINQYLQSVIAHIRSKEAKAYVEAELSNHMKHSKLSWMAKGYTEKEAEDKAASEMGSPSELGKSLNEIHKPKIDWLLLSLFIGILLLSFLPILALNQPHYEYRYGHMIPAFLSNHVIHIILGFVIALGLMFLDYRRFAQLGYVFFGIASLFIIFLYGFYNAQVNGKVMIQIGFISLKVWMAIPLYCIAWAALFSKQNFALWKAIVMMGISFILFSMNADLSILLIYGALVAVLFMKSKFSRKQKSIVIGAVAALIIGFIIFTWSSYQNGSIAKYQIDRLLGFLNPAGYADGAGYINVMLTDLLQGAKWFGPGTTYKLPEAHTDLVFGHLIQSYGLALAIGIFIILSLVMMRFLHVTASVKDSFGRLIITGCITIFSTQFIYAVGMTLGLVPIVSVSLPFFSYGFMPTVLNAFLIGLVLSVYRRKHFVQVLHVPKTTSRTSN